MSLLTMFLIIALCSFSKAMMDLSADNKLAARKWNKINSWKNKWKLDSEGKVMSNKKRSFYYLWIYKPNYIERFPYSSTILVFLTDFWHFWQKIFILSMFFLICFPVYLETKNIMSSFVLLTSLFLVCFETFYKTLSKKQK